MRPDYELARLRLINWHNFVDETIDVDGSLFLIGDNGSGKTTLLDAVHCALTGDWKVELNAAARVGGRRGQGRDLTGVVLRYDVETGYKRAGGTIAYAALEFRRSATASTGTERMSLGLGVFVNSPEARPEKWGFVVNRPLADVPLLAPVDGGGQRPVDRRELSATLSGGRVLDIGRYRTLVGERLFGSRDHLEQTASFLQSGKSYRELVTKTANFGELFGRLLREPDVESYQEARRALAALEQLRTDRVALAEELDRLRALIDWCGQVAQARESIARYAYLECRHEANATERAVTKSARSVEEAEARRDALAEEQQRTVARKDSLASERDRLRSSEGGQLLDQERHSSRELEDRTRLADKHRHEHDEESLRLADYESDLAETVAEIRDHAARLLDVCNRFALVSGPDLDPAAIAPLQKAFDTLAADPDSAFEHTTAVARLRDVTSAVRDAIEAVKLRRDEAQRTADSARGALESASAEVDALRARGEVAPPLEDCTAATELLRSAEIDSTAVYRVIEPRRGLSLEALGLIERTLGPRVLGALLVAPEDHERARKLLFDHDVRVPLVAVDEPRADEASRWFGSGDATETVFSQLRLAKSDHTRFTRHLLEHHAGSLLWLRETCDGEYLTHDGRLHAARLDERVPSGPARFIGAKARKLAFDAELEQAESRVQSARELVTHHDRIAQDARARAAELGDALEQLDGLELAKLGFAVRERNNLRESVGQTRGRVARLRDELVAAETARDTLAETVASLRAAISESDGAAIAARLTHIDRELDTVSRRLREVDQDYGQQRSDAGRAQDELRAARQARVAANERLTDARNTLMVHLDEKARADLDDYVLRVKRGAQIKPANLEAHREAAIRSEAGFVANITGAEGVRNPLLWQKYAFQYDEARNSLLDSTETAIETVTAGLQARVDELDQAMEERNRDLLERIVLEDLVGTLQRDLVELSTTVREVNRLIEDLRFGDSRYRIEAPIKPEFRALFKLLGSSSGLSPHRREELKQFFAARLDEFAGQSEDRLPSFLDYRQWHDFRIHMSTLDSDGVELSRERLNQGSGGEQAVPNYLLLFCLTALLYDGIGAKARLLLLDEAFYGVDHGRRTELLRFCNRAGITLVLATPEMDGVTDALAASTTLLIEKTPDHDVFLWDARMQQKAATLFEDSDVDPEKLVLGVDPPARPAPPHREAMEGGAGG